ncbi:Beta-galactosidase-1-like protein [Coemansia sp. RSA 1285]|nr:Beta-galactosidase-1-like protein [Coemansia sp. RSA 1804]KAJ2692553.1 Beta-galactosidase-1-like protein [Coemansia sp. RSA 1285]
MRAVLAALVYLISCALLLAAGCQGMDHGAYLPDRPYTVGYSSRGLVIDGTPQVLVAGAIHYPRSTPGMWDSLMKKAKAGGINTIDTYVFWNMHERTKGVYDFATDRANLPQFLETARRNGLFVMLRIGPFVCAEWNYGGFPQWLRHEDGIVFRTYSAPFMEHMRRFVAKVVAVAAPFMPERGGPVVALQIENEYGNIQPAYGRDGDRYATWCGETAHALNASVPWIMCRQYSHVPHVIPTQNDFYSDQYLERYRERFPEYPAMWTELWPAWFQRWGDAVPFRPAEDTAYAVARWFAFGGSYVAYYMYHGGTNFGRTASPFVTTSYDYDGFLDQYGLENWPKYLHLAQLHRALLDSADVLVANAVPDSVALSGGDAKHVLAKQYGSSDDYLAFLINADSDPDHRTPSVRFDGLRLKLPRWSVTLVRRRPADTRPVVLLNTATLSAAARYALEHPPRFEHISAPPPDAPDPVRADSIRWRAVRLPAALDADGAVYPRPPEQLSITDDTTDFLWYRTTVRVPASCATNQTLVLRDAGDIASLYVDGRFFGMRYDKQEELSTLSFDISALFAAGKTKKKHGEEAEIAVLSQTMGIAHNEFHMEAYARGLLGSVLLCGHDITMGTWRVSKGIEGEPEAGDELRHGGGSAADSTPPSLARSFWQPYSAAAAAAADSGTEFSRIRWYAIDIDADALVAAEQHAATEDGGEPVRYAIDMAAMTKGQLWINGHHLGRYWLRRAPAASDDTFGSSNGNICRQCDYAGRYSPGKCLRGCGEYTQRFYHLPRSYLNMPPSGDGDAGDSKKGREEKERSSKLSTTNTLYVLEEIGGNPRLISIARRVSVRPPASLPPSPPDNGGDDDEDSGSGHRWLALLRLLSRLLLVLSSFAVLAALGGVLALLWKRWRDSSSAHRGYERIE